MVEVDFAARCAEKEWQAVEAVEKIAEKCGGYACLVGGGVRDVLMGRRPKDLDVEVYGVEADGFKRELGKKFKLNLVGMSFGVIKLSGVEVDVAFPRQENKQGRGHRGFVVAAQTDLNYAEAAKRRDFTVNAIMFDLKRQEILDPYNGLADLEKGVLRPVSEQFGEDPLRVLRAMQFLARFEFRAAAELVAVCRQMTPEGLAVERLGEEWKKLLLKGKKPSVGLEFLRACGWIKYYPELAALSGCPQYKEWHPEGDVWQHTMYCVDAAAKLRSGNEQDDLVLMLAVLCHDFGKVDTTCLEADGRITSKNHEMAGGEPTLRFLSRLWRDKDWPKLVKNLVENHLAPYTFYYNGATAKAFRRLSQRVERLDLLKLVAQADSAGRPPLGVDMEPLAWFESQVEALNIAKGAPAAIILGRHVLSLGVKPGKQVGELVKQCYEAQLDGEFDNLVDGMKFLEKLRKKYESE